jgi:hypothetical protein
MFRDSLKRLLNQSLMVRSDITSKNLEERSLNLLKLSKIYKEFSLRRRITLINRA